MNSETNLEHDMAQVLSYRHFNLDTHALSQDIGCGVVGVQSDTVGSFTQSISVFPVIIIPRSCTHLSHKL